MSRRTINIGDVYWIDPNPVAGRELKDRHRFVVITRKEINALGVVIRLHVKPLPLGGGYKCAFDLAFTSVYNFPCADGASRPKSACRWESAVLPVEALLAKSVGVNLLFLLVPLKLEAPSFR